MRTRRHVLSRYLMGLLLGVAATLAGCGYVGDPLPPRLEIPRRVTDLRGVQRGASLLLAFTATLQATDSTMLHHLGPLELRCGRPPAGSFEFRTWAAAAPAFAVAGEGAGAREVSVPVSAWLGQEVVCAVRLAGPTGKLSEWSNPLVVPLVAAPAVPGAVMVAGHPQGAQVQWDGPGTSWRLWRMAEGETEPSVLGVATEPSWLDRTVEWDKSYVYTVQQLVAQDGREAESELSGPVRYQHIDRFPPSVPGGFSALAGLRSVELSWDRAIEADCIGYYVYRAEGDGKLKKISGLVTVTAYSDTTVAAGKRYRYAVSAVDDKQNESQSCAAAEIQMP